MNGSGEETRETIRPEFNPAIMTDFQGAKITSDTGSRHLGKSSTHETKLHRSWVSDPVVSADE